MRPGFLAAFMLLFGSINSITKKIMYAVHVKVPYSEVTVQFKKPLFCTAFMFIGEASCLVVYYIRARARKQHLLDEEGKKHDPTSGLGMPKFIGYATLFGFCDCVSTVLTGIGLLHCTASVTQILRGFVIIATMLLGRIVLKRVPSRFQIAGVAVVIVGLILVGVQAVVCNTDSEPHTASETSLAIVLILLAQFASATQFIFEEITLGASKPGQPRRNVDPMFLVGWEGVMGFIICAALVLPIAHFVPGKDHGSFENLVDAVYMLVHSWPAAGLQFGYTISIAFFNCCGLAVSKALTSVHRALVDTLRTIIVWFFMVALWLGGSSIGEGLTWWSFMEGAGFVLMIAGNCCHNNIGGMGDRVNALLSRKKPETYEPLEETAEEE